MPEKIIRNRIFSRGLTIIIIGILFNLIGLNIIQQDIPFPLILWGWNILVFIGFSQIFSYYALKFKKPTRAVIGLIIIFISPPIREFLYLNMESNIFIWILHFIITSPTPEIPLLPWLAVCFISTIFGEYLYEAMITGTEDAYIGLFRIFLIWGLILVIAGIALGLNLQTPETMSVAEYPHLHLYTVMNQQDYYHFPGLPEFLIRGTWGNMLYNLGAALVLLAVCFYYIDIKKADNDFITMLEYYGKISLSLFLVHYLFIPIFVGQFSMIFFPFVCLAYIGFMGFFMYIWNEYGNGFGSPEWIMIQISRIGQKTGETVKKEVTRTEEFLTKEFKKTEEFIKKESKKIAERTKEMFKKEKEKPKKET